MTQGGSLQNMIAGKAIGFKEAMFDEFKDYAKQILINAKTLCSELQRYGFKILTNGTDNHMMLLDLRGTGVTGKQLEHALEQVGIATNKNAIPFDTEKPTITSGLRLGVPNVTSRGMKEPEMKEIASIIHIVFNQLQTTGELPQDCISSLREDVRNLTKKFPIDI